MLSIVASIPGTGGGFSAVAATVSEPASILSLSPDALGSPTMAFTVSWTMLTVAAPAKNQLEDTAMGAARNGMRAMEDAPTFTAPAWVKTDHRVCAVGWLAISLWLTEAPKDF